MPDFERVFLMLKYTDIPPGTPCIGLKIKYPSCLSMTFEFSRRNFEKYSTIRPVGAELFHADGQTDRHDKGNSRLSQFCGRA